jgi:hypothetical protein
MTAVIGFIWLREKVLSGSAGTVGSKQRDRGNRKVDRQIAFLDCPAYLDEEGTVRCGLPAEVTCRFIMDSTDGPLESVMIRCPAYHVFNAPIELLALKKQPSTAELERRAAGKQR